MLGGNELGESVIVKRFVNDLAFQFELKQPCKHIFQHYFFSSKRQTNHKHSNTPPPTTTRSHTTNLTLTMNVNDNKSYSNHSNSDVIIMFITQNYNTTTTTTMWIKFNGSSNRRQAH
mmetsp:Transcript_1175/g.1285  ORF Transcript_1175/g.1285 Transcript_1175/m.1285 type:complete len:117 (-) Transcript_1175:571-921(-)